MQDKYDKIYIHMICETIKRTTDFINLFWLWNDLIEDELFTAVVEKLSEIEGIEKIIENGLTEIEGRLYLKTIVKIKQEDVIFKVSKYYDYCKQEKNNIFACYKLLIENYEKLMMGASINDKR